MKVVIVNKSDRTGGAAVACFRLFKALEKAETLVSMLVQEKRTTDIHITTTTKSWLKSKKNFIRFAFERLLFSFQVVNREQLFAFTPASNGENIARQELIKNADVIHLHWINQGFLSLSDLKALVKLKKPIVWTFHDMWAFTGGCHYAGDCVNYKIACQDCHFLRNPGQFDLSSKIFEKKMAIFKSANISIVTCSRWLADCVRESRLMEGFPIMNIPNPIDTSVFYPKEKIKSREKLNLPSDKKLILFGAANIMDKRKGIKYLIEALDNWILSKPEIKDKVELVVFGKSKEDISNLFTMKINQLSLITSIDDLVDLYSACDLFALPSLEDNLPNTVMEAMACGTPVVAFRSGGLPEMIDHQVNGYLAEYKSADDFASGLDWIINHANRLEISEKCVKKTLANYSESSVAQRYLDVYSAILRDKKPKVC